jgi:putative inorganic carbon (hco3(-)) transporter
VSWPPAASGPLRLARSGELPTWVLAGVALAGLLLGAGIASLSVHLGLWVFLLLVVPLLAVLAMAKPLWATALILLSMPVGIREVPAGPFTLPIIQMVTIGMTGLVMLGRLTAQEPPLRWPRPMWWVAILTAIAVLETPSAINVDAAIGQDAQLVCGILVALAIVTSARRMRDLRRLVGVALLSGSWMCLVALPGAAEQRASFGAAVVQNRAVGLFSDPNQLGAFSAILLFLAFGLWLGGRRSWVRAGAVLLALLALSTLLLSLSRGSWIGAAVGVVTMVVLLPRMARWTLVLSGLLLLVMLVALVLSGWTTPRFDIIGARLQTLTNARANPYDARPLIYREAWRETQARPWTGFGPGGFAAASSLPESAIASSGAYHAHNVLLTVAAEAGLPAVAVVIAFTVAIGLALRRAISRLQDSDDRRDRALIAALGGAMMAVVGQGTVDFILRSPVIVMLIWALVGLALAADRITSEAAITPRTEPE